MFLRHVTGFVQMGHIYAKFHNQPFIMRRAIWGHVPGYTHTHTIKFIKFNWVTGSPPKFDTLLAVCYWTYMQRFIISHSSCAEQYGDMILNIVLKCNWVTGSPPKFDTLLAVWYRTYMQSFIISHSSCAEQYGDMSPDTHTHTHTQLNLLNLIGSLGHHQNLTHCWQYGTGHTCKVS